MTIPPRKSTPSYERHPLSEVWPGLEPMALQALRDSMLRRGYDDLEPVVLYEGRVLDGWHRCSIARELGIEVPTVDYQGVDPAGFVIDRHTGRRNLTPGQRARGVVSCRDWASAGRPASCKPSADLGAGAPETRSTDRVSRPSTNQELAAEADVSESTIRRAKAAIREQKEEHNDGSAAVQAAAAPPGEETQAPAVDAANTMEAPAVSAGSSSGCDSSLHNESSAALEDEAVGPATLEMVSTEPAADQASGRSKPSTGIDMAPTAAPASSDRCSSSPTEREVVESSTAEATDSDGHRPVASEPGGTEAAGPAGGWTPSDSASSSDSGSGGTTAAVRDAVDPESGGVNASPDPARLLPAPLAVAGRETPDGHVQGVDVATAGESARDAGAEFRQCLTDLRTGAERLEAISRVGRRSRLEATGRLIHDLVAAMEQCVAAGLDEEVMVAALPTELVRCLDAQRTTDTVRGTSTQDESNPDGRGRGSAAIEPASKPGGWAAKLKTTLDSYRSRQP